MAISVEVDQAIESGKDFEVTLSVDDGEAQGTFNMAVRVKGVARMFSISVPGVILKPPALFQIVKVRDQNTWTVLDWGTGAVGDPVVVTLEEIAPGSRNGSDLGAIVP